MRSVVVMQNEGDYVNHVQGFMAFLNSEVNPQKNPHGGEVDFSEKEIYFNFSSQRFTKPLSEIMNPH